MSSPFPGMDPYIEACELWEDFHQDLMSEIKSALVRVVPDHYAVRFGERSYVAIVSSEEVGSLKRHMSQANVSIVSTRQQGFATDLTQAAVAVLPETDEEDAPVSMRALVEVEFREAFVEIYSLRPERHLVTTIEVLSPSNKRFESPGWMRYYRKRQAHLEGNANLVEIDLLRTGRRMPMESEWPHSPYYVLVSRKESAPVCSVWPAHYVRSLPKVRVPLEPPDADVELAIQPLVDSIYARSRYELDIDYRQPCQPPLDASHAAWVSERLANAN